MRLITGTSVLLYISCVLAFVVPLIKNGLRPQLGFKLQNIPLRQLGLVLLLFLGVYAIGTALHLELVAGLPYFLAGLFGYGLLSGFSFAQSGMRGSILLMMALALTGAINDAAALQLPLSSFLLGLTATRFVSDETAWKDYWLAASWCIGTVWIAVAGPEAMMTAYQSILAIFLSVVLLLRTIQNLPILPEKNPVIRPAFVVITAGLAAWLCTQVLVVQPALLKWVWLLVGGSLLSFLMLDTNDAVSTEDNRSASLLRGAINLVLVGIAALLASRLFGTLGWVVLAIGLLANVRASNTVAIAALFFLGRSLLQVFILQYNPNVTGINITHPYAGAALYVGFASMLLLPQLLNNVLLSQSQQNHCSSPLTLALLPFAAVVAGGLSNYFLHAEATGSLLVALTVAGVGTALLGHVRQLGATVMLFPLLGINSALLAHELLNAGSEAEKSQKILVLGAVLLIMLVTGLGLWKGASSGRKPVQVS